MFEKQPKSINELRQVIEDTANNMDSKVLHKVVENFIKRAETCVKYGGGHFEHQLTYIFRIRL